MSAVTPVTPTDDTAAVTPATSQPGTTTPVTASHVNLSTVASLQKDAPQVWNAMMLGIGMQGIKEMQDSEARRKAAQRESQNR